MQKIYSFTSINKVSRFDPICPILLIVLFKFVVMFLFNKLEMKITNCIIFFVCSKIQNTQICVCTKLWISKFFLEYDELQIKNLSFSLASYFNEKEKMINLLVMATLPRIHG
jgi:hypothetical protein